MEDSLPKQMEAKMERQCAVWMKGICLTSGVLGVTAMDTTQIIAPQQAELNLVAEHLLTQEEHWCNS